MKRCLLILLKAAAFVLVAAVYVWFAPVLLSEIASGKTERREIQRRNNEYWFRRHGFNQWFRHFERAQYKKRKKRWKKRNDFFK